MTDEMPKIICDRCGQSVYKRDLSLEDLRQVKTSDMHSFIDSLVTNKGIPKEVAISWAEHGLYRTCNEAKRNCLKCDNQLKTWRAKLCLECGTTFEPWTSIEQNT